MAGIWLHFAIIHFHDQIELVTRCKNGDALDIAFTLAYRSISSHFTCAIAFFIYLNRIYYNFFFCLQLTSSCLTIFLGIGDFGDMKWEKNCFFLFAAFWNEGKKISVTIGEKKTEQSDVMNESKNEPEILWCLCKKKKEKKRKEKKEKSNSIVGGRACNEGWQIGKRAYYCHLLNNQNVSLLPSNSPPIFFPFCVSQMKYGFFSEQLCFHFILLSFPDTTEDEGREKNVFIFDWFPCKLTSYSEVYRELNARLSFWMTTELLVSLISLKSQLFHLFFSFLFSPGFSFFLFSL